MEMVRSRLCLPDGAGMGSVGSYLSGRKVAGLMIKTAGARYAVPLHKERRMEVGFVDISIMVLS